MSESVPSRPDAVDATPGHAPAPPVGGLVPAADAALVTPEAIEQMAERLRFYESFDELIQQNIARSGQLLREAADKRDEAVAAIARTREQIEAERETQRATLTELLDDVMTIQQATERLAHRVSDALEQIEFELEPVGLQAPGSLLGQRPDQLPDTTATRSRHDQSVAEDVHDEVRHGVIGQRPPGLAAGAGPTGDDARDDRLPSSGSAPPPTGGSMAAASSDNPETSAPAGEGTVQHDFASPTEQMLSGNESGSHEPEIGEGPEAAPVESSTTGWAVTEPEPTPVADPAVMDGMNGEAESGPPLDDRRDEGTSGSTFDPATRLEPSGSGGASESPPGDGVTPVIAGAAPVSQGRTTVVLDGIPRAAIALAIQRHLLAKPDVLRAEVREYYDHRLTLYVTARRSTTADDLEDWDGGGTWQRIRSSPELLELRMVM
ncbi:MAG: hypothetical protein AVDCRST_MAG33-1650 [uncultured Thermomicrobiales bacterium]|uniref:Uncharacterized protein n=1 Tax=uncultured Thermomicrobiales bacterium TaxID=1645740 RepID=A0A6J4UXE9_9BACT|nr:MAG: hypothetical protein AVDCRST_MAG33-1650 [uncultured Thermomicrobiales bacterium]